MVLNSSARAACGSPAPAARVSCPRPIIVACHARSTGEVRMYRMTAIRASRAARAAAVSDHGFGVLAITSRPLGDGLAVTARPLQLPRRGAGVPLWRGWWSSAAAGGAGPPTARAGRPSPHGARETSEGLLTPAQPRADQPVLCV